MRLSKFIHSLIPRLICTALAMLATTGAAYVVSIYWTYSWNDMLVGVYLSTCSLIGIDLGRASADAKWG